jgi:hypothetical protein
VASTDTGLTLLHMTVAFASSVHASAALEFLARASVEMTATERPTSDGGDLALVDIDVASHEHGRLRTLLAVHALVIEDGAVASASAA